MLPGLPAVVEDVAIGAAGVFQRVGEDRQAVEGAVIVDGLGNGRGSRITPRGVERSGAKGIAQHVAKTIGFRYRSPSRRFPLEMPEKIGPTSDWCNENICRVTMHQFQLDIRSYTTADCKLRRSRFVVGITPDGPPPPKIGGSNRLAGVLAILAGRHQLIRRCESVSEVLRRGKSLPAARIAQRFPESTAPGARQQARLAVGNAAPEWQHEVHPIASKPLRFRHGQFSHFCTLRHPSPVHGASRAAVFGPALTPGLLRQRFLPRPVHGPSRCAGLSHCTNRRLKPHGEKPRERG